MDVNGENHSEVEIAAKYVPVDIKLEARESLTSRSRYFKRGII